MSSSASSEASSGMEEEVAEQFLDESSSSTDEDATSHRSEQQQPLAKDHSYLDASHPLLPSNPAFPNNLETFRGSSADGGNNLDDDKFFARTAERKEQPFELAVLELPGVVLFPGCTIPIKLCNKAMIRYLGRQIRLCRTHPELQPKVELGVMTLQAITDDPLTTSERRYLRTTFGRMALPPTQTQRPYPRRLLLERLQQRGNQHQAPPQNPRYVEPPPTHPYIGMIGTIATIRHTHERTDGTTANTIATSNNNSNSSSVWSQYEDANELVLTAVGTSRFQIVDVVDEEYTTRGNKIFMVEELLDDPMARPQSTMKPFSSLRRLVDESDSESNQDSQSDDGSGFVSYSCRARQSLHAWNMSQVTPTPYHVLDRFSPWSLMERLIEALESNAGSNNNLPSLQSGGMDPKLLEPTRFSFWIANNAPFSESQRLKLLSMDSTLERLLTLWKDIKEMTTNPLLICCNDCNSILSLANDVFMVAGAEGSTSAYVNAAGYIHQITTLRKLIDDNKVFFDGHPSTHNSYFPGYSWHITMCRRCDCLLGWKFCKVGKESEESADRPDTFFGFMSSNVVTKQLT